MTSSHFNLRVAHSLVTSIAGVTTLLMFLLFAGCDDNAPQGETETDKTRKLLTSGTWVIEGVTIDGVDNTDKYKGFKLTFTSSGFTATSGGVVWPTSGIWTFTDNTARVIMRSDDVPMAIEKISETELILTLPWPDTTFGPGRVESVEGEYRFVFGK